MPRSRAAATAQATPLPLSAPSSLGCAAEGGAPRRYTEHHWLTWQSLGSGSPPGVPPPGLRQVFGGCTGSGRLVNPTAFGASSGPWPRGRPREVATACSRPELMPTRTRWGRGLSSRSPKVICPPAALTGSATGMLTSGPAPQPGCWSHPTSVPLNPGLWIRSALPFLYALSRGHSASLASTPSSLQP